LKSWEGLGYYSRARNLLRAARIIESKYKGLIPDQIEDFRKLPGIGPYIAAAVFSISRGVPIPAVDGNVMRVFCRLKMFSMDIRNSKTRKRVVEALMDIIPKKRSGDFNQALMELGATICKPRNPECLACPLNTHCQAFLTKQTERYPLRLSRSKVPEYPVSLAVIISGDQFYIQKRPSSGHLGGLWEFPGGKALPGESAVQTLKREIFEELGIKIDIKTKMATINHAYSHFKVKLSFFECNIPDGNQIQSSNPFQWISIQQIKEFPFPGANHKFFPTLRSRFKK
jgi:A/G-specific adenine glycosylase